EHPGIVPIHEVGERDGSCYFSMKFVEGGQLDEVVRHAPMSSRQAAELVARVARTVHYAHEHGILNRDIKPGIILLHEKGEPRLLNPKIDRDLSTICLKCLEKDPKRRYSSALALAEDLERWLRHEPIRARHTGIFARGRKWLQRNPTSALLAASLIALAAAAGWIVWKSESEFVPHPVPNGIAVLPFENLSPDPKNAYFAEGIHEEILTRLASIAGLKVISRTSTQQYQSKPRNLREIAKQLGVANILEGSVQ